MTPDQIAALDREELIATLAQIDPEFACEVDTNGCEMTTDDLRREVRAAHGYPREEPDQLAQSSSAAAQQRGDVGAILREAFPYRVGPGFTALQLDPPGVVVELRTGDMARVVLCPDGSPVVVLEVARLPGRRLASPFIIAFNRMELRQ